MWTVKIRNNISFLKRSRQQQQKTIEYFTHTHTSWKENGEYIYELWCTLSIALHFTTLKKKQIFFFRMGQSAFLGKKGKWLFLIHAEGRKNIKWKHKCVSIDACIYTILFLLQLTISMSWLLHHVTSSFYSFESDFGAIVRRKRVTTFQQQCMYLLCTFWFASNTLDLVPFDWKNAYYISSKYVFIWKNKTKEKNL